MLSVCIDGREVETTPVSLAKLVLDGRVDRHCPSKTPGTSAERSLEQSLESPHCEALSDELLCRLRSMYASESPAVDILELCERVERLCQWHWANPHIAARFLWTAAWLNDVMDRLETAAQFYDAFLQTSSRDEHLRLLAYNNRGVLRIRLGRLEGVPDLARAAVPRAWGAEDDRSQRNSAVKDSQVNGLPAACFNLLNLIHVALESARLTRAVDEELAEFFCQLPEDARTLWLGRDPAPEGRELPGESDRAEGSAANLVILRDATYARLNTLTTCLAARAGRLAGRDMSPGTGRPAMGASQLLLWDSRSTGEEHPGDARGMKVNGAGEDSYGYCAEAASLLLSEDIPSSLTRLETPLARAEQAAREELASIESRLVLNQYELVKSRLQAQRRILFSLDRRGRLAGLLARVDAQLERVAHLESQSEQLDLQRTCAALISRVEQFCRLTDLSRARREHEDLTCRLGCVRSALEARTGNDVTVLLDELTARLDRHMLRLRRVEVRRGIRNPLRILRQKWPRDWATPIPDQVYQALGQCHLGDPQCLVEDWTALRERLDGHQGQHHLHRALAVLRNGQPSWNEAEGDVTRALLLKPDLWTTIAPLLGLFPGSQPSALPAAGDDGPVRRTGALLERVFEQMDTQAGRCLSLWRCVAATLSPVLEREDLDAIAQVRDLAETCLDRWPSGMAELPGRADPRHPVNLFLESCEKARQLAVAGQWLNARPPRWDEAGRCYRDLLTMGLDTRDQLRRAATGYYLAAYHGEDAPHVQRQVLGSLESWIAGRPQGWEQSVREQQVVEEIARWRAAVSAGRLGPAAERPAREGAVRSEDCYPKDRKGGGCDPQEEGKSQP